ncbi:alpha/beta hydrolase-fold protein [Aliikangiella sp. G2MR2-5]|uniref:alpha/beta hydrolase-fold protein n=1 Tax=Aliikangiella sp. G2MR2-5 TaxID=2788943 RepID=UPI0018AAA113|nr:alpha/beta hydrolase-fold protein [Aliikangiella sp. G2MR2-5]
MKRLVGLLVGILIGILSLNGWAESSSTEYRPIVIGSKFNITSKILGEDKEIYVSLPHKYDERVHDYPVIYVLEAEYLFDSVRSIAKLMATRSHMPQSIIVGIANGSYSKRFDMDLPTHGGKPEKHLQFLKNELIPHIEKNYRANSHRTIVGLSPTNGLIFEAFWAEPELFKGYIALSAHLEWDPVKNVKLIDKFIDTITKPDYPKTTIYMGRAGLDLQEDPSYQKYYKEAADKLSKKPVTNVTYKIEILKDEEHYAMALPGIKNGFELIYPREKWTDFNFSWKDEPVEKIKRHYEGLSKLYGFDVYPIEDGHNYGSHLSGLAHNSSRFGKNKQAIEVLKLGIGYYPNSANLYMKLAEAYKKEGQQKLAKQANDKAVMLAEKYHPEDMKAFELISQQFGK